jgi:hypothetical protein
MTEETPASADARERPTDDGPTVSMLVCGPATRRRLEAVLAAGRLRERTDGLVVVTTERSPERVWRGLQAPSEQVRFVDARPRAASVRHVDGRVAVHDPSTGLDVRSVGEAILDAGDALGHEGATRPHIAVEALGPLLSHGTFEQLYRLLHVLAAHVEEADGRLVVGVDPTEQDDRTERVLGWLFDERRPVSADRRA